MSEFWNPYAPLDSRRRRLLGVGAALAVLLQCRRAALARASRLQLLNLPPALASLAQLYGVQALLLD